MKPFLFHPDALAEADEAARFYDEQEKGLGKKFVEALTDTISRVRNNPELYGKIYNNIRNVVCYIFLTVLFTVVKKKS